MREFAKELKKILDEFKGPSPYDTSAVVKRVEDGTAWVHIPGGVDETPVDLTLNAAPGDKVMVRVSRSGAFLIGNASAPPTDDSKAMEIARKTDRFAKRIEDAEEAAGEAAEVASAINQKVWSDEGGLHIADGKKDAAAERNSIWNSLGMLFRKGLNPILGVLTGNNPRVAIYDGQGDGEEHEVASFGKEIIMYRGGKRFFTLRKKSFGSDPELILGDEEDRCTVVDKTGVTIKDATTDSSFNYNARGMFNHIGFYQETGVDGRHWEFTDLQIWSYESYATNGMTIWSKDQYRRFSFPRKKIVAIKNTSDVEMIVVTKGVLVAAQWVLGVNVVQLSIQFRTSGSIPAGQNAFEAELSDGAVSYLPLAQAYGVGYYGSAAMLMAVNAAGKITIRNTGSTAVSVQSPNSCLCVATYITDGDFGSEFE